MITGVPQPWQTTGHVTKPVAQPSILSRTLRWLPAFVLSFLCASSFVCTLTLVILPLTRLAAPFGIGYVPFISTAAILPPPSFGYMVLILYSPVWALAVASFVATLRTPPGHVPQWLYSRDQGDKHYFHNVLQAVERKFDDSIRFCRKCGAFKPDLAHHSKQLGLCILCYQHWDVWSNNAIGFYNHKAYLLSLFYATLAHVFSLALLLPGLRQQWHEAAPSSGEPAEQLIALALWAGGEGSVLAYAALSWCGRHSRWRHALLARLPRVAHNARSHSARILRHAPHKPPKRDIGGRPFDFGARGNFLRTCGKTPLLWFLPTNAGVEGNGIFFDLAVDPSPQPQAMSGEGHEAHRLQHHFKVVARRPRPGFGTALKTPCEPSTCGNLSYVHESSRGIPRPAAGLGHACPTRPPVDV